MSVQAISWALKQRTGSAGCKLVLLVLANVADCEGRSWYPQKKLAVMADMSTRSLRDNLIKLEAMGLLKREEGFRENGSRTVDVYMLMLDVELPSPERTPPPPEHASGAHRNMPPVAPEATDPSCSVSASVKATSIAPASQNDELALGVERTKKAAPLIPMAMDWLPPASVDEFASSIGLSAEYVDQELPKFKRHFMAAGIRRTDRGWVMSLRKWLANSVEINARRTGGRTGKPRSNGPSGHTRSQLKQMGWDVTPQMSLS